MIMLLSWCCLSKSAFTISGPCEMLSRQGLNWLKTGWEEDVEDEYTQEPIFHKVFLVRDCFESMGGTGDKATQIEWQGGAAGQGSRHCLLGMRTEAGMLEMVPVAQSAASWGDQRRQDSTCVKMSAKETAALARCCHGTEGFLS